ncbi:MAG: hypothetical protein ABSE49_33400, partial [Polyangiaceae bacterium]
MAKRVAFRFAAIYFVLYFLPFPIDVLFESPGAPPWYARFWDVPVNALGRLLGIHVELRTVDGPDGLGHYVQLLCFALVAAVATGIWSALDRREPRDRLAHSLLCVWLRYVLAAWMLAFGFAKVIPSQMPLPDPSVLVLPYGESTPMKLLWTFMGTAPAYEQFAGFGELIGGLLLLARRTTALGALLCAGVLANVVMMNVCYDVYVKVQATHLLMLSLFLLLPSARRLVDALVLGRAVPALDLESRVPAPWRRPLLAAKVAFIGGILYSQAAPAARHYAAVDGAPLPEPYGVYDVEEMRRDGELVAPLLTDATYWHRVYFGRRGMGVVHADGSQQTLALPGGSRGAWAWTGSVFTVGHEEDGRLLVEGTLGGNKVAVRARPTDLKNLRLVQRPFHWYFE